MQRLQMLHIDCGVDVDPGPQQFLHILVPLGMTAAPRVRMGQFIHQDQLWSARQGSVQVKLPQPDPPVVDRCRRERLKPLQQCQGIRPGVGLDIAGDNVDPLFLGLMGGLQHGVCFSNSRSISEEYLQNSGCFCGSSAPRGAGLRLLDLFHRSVLLRHWSTTFFIPVLIVPCERL